MRTRHQNQRVLTVGVLAARTGITPDTIRYYERLGLVKTPRRTENGYRLFTEADVRRLHFIRRAKLLGLSLEEIQNLLHLADAGECQPLRGQVAELLHGKIADCERLLADLQSLKAHLEEWYQGMLDRQQEPACACADFPATCACLPVQVDALYQIAVTDAERN